MPITVDQGGKPMDHVQGAFARLVSRRQTLMLLGALYLYLVITKVRHAAERAQVEA
jgi:hypothetical protein